MVLQRTSTIKFWDRYHNENASQEWIAQPKKELLELIFHRYWKHHHHCPNNNSKDDDDDDAGDDASSFSSSSSSSCTSRPSMIRRNDTSMYVLEIGCGTSNLLRDLKVHIESKIRALQVVACGTDVSNSCIDVQQTRQRQQKQKQHNRKNNKCSRSGGGTDKNDNDNEHDDLWYEVLNCLDDDTEQQKHLPTPSSSVSLSSPPALLLPSHRHHNRWDLIIDKGCLGE